MKLPGCDIAQKVVLPPGSVSLFFASRGDARQGCGRARRWHRSFSHESVRDEFLEACGPQNRDGDPLLKLPVAGGSPQLARPDPARDVWRAQVGG
eukprot:1703782-Pyramimonas_sp.AAC.2